MPNSSLPVPLYRQQSEGDCLPTCVQMVLAYWGQFVSRDSLMRQFATDPNVGTPGSRVLRLQSAAWSVIYRRADENDLRRWMAQRIPAILLVSTSELPYWSRRCAHAVVLVGLEGSAAYVNDPAFETAPISVALGNLLLASDTMDNLAAVIAPASMAGLTGPR